MTLGGKWLMLAGVFALASCSRSLRPETGNDTDRDSTDDTDLDSFDTDTDDDSDTDPGDILDCSADYTTPSASGGLGPFPSCYTEQLLCNTITLATLGGGPDEMDSYTEWGCGLSFNFNGPERTYGFVKESGVSAEIRLYTECSSNLHMIEFQQGNSLQSDIDNGRVCANYETGRGCDIGTTRPDYEELTYPSESIEKTFELMVDGPPGGHNFAIEVICD